MRRAPRVRFRARAELDGVDARAVRAIVERVWELYAGPAGEIIEVVLMSEEEHTALHAEFLDDPSSTDVMAFPYGDEDLFGEVLVNRDVAVTEARNRRKEAAGEVLLYVAHGALHLLGFRDDTPGARAEMRAAERRALG
ncbi:MAG: rRNA maturation RNase YbeY [Planctomycetes bacterium]|nr:rRNA maturation RNase YbeY [Planctomycetota bacterium]